MAPDPLADLCGTRSELLDLFESQRKFVEGYLADGTTRSFAPNLVVLTKTHPGAEAQRLLYSLHVNFNEDHEKRTLLRSLGAGMYAQRTFPVCACLASEAWLSRQRAGTAAPYCQPRHDPARQEIIILGGLSLDGKQAAMQQLAIHRDGGMIVPEEWGEVLFETRMPLLAQFFVGFADAVQALRCAEDGA